MDPSLLDRQWTVEEVEAAHLVSKPGLGPDPVPFGFIHFHWVALLAKMEEGDEIWSYCSSKKSWDNLAGRQGYVILRDGESIGGITTLMN